MKKTFLLTACSILLAAVFFSCSHFHHGDDISISLKDSRDSYKMIAYFNENQTARVHKYMDEQLGRRNNFSFTNAVMDATLTLDDRTTFYIKSSPGDIEINFEKEKNSYESYVQVKKMCEGIKTVLAK